MVLLMKNAEGISGNHRNRVRILEIIGPAGAGKTTFYKALEKYPQHFQLSNFPDVHKTADAPFFVNHGLQLVPAYPAIITPGQPPIKPAGICVDVCLERLAVRLAERCENKFPGYRSGPGTRVSVGGDERIRPSLSAEAGR